MGKRGLFVVFEGIDGSGKSTQVHHFIRALEHRSKYIDVLRTHEPWRSEEIKRELASDTDLYKDGVKMAALFVNDRKNHSMQLIYPALQKEVFVVCDRYSLSTCAYQAAQGVPLDALVKMHQHEAILIPDLTYYVHVSVVVAQERMRCRGLPAEKFEKQIDFTSTLLNRYDDLCNRQSVSPYRDVFGPIAFVDGAQSVETIAQRIQNIFEPHYQQWHDNS